MTVPMTVTVEAEAAMRQRGHTRGVTSWWIPTPSAAGGFLNGREYHWLPAAGRWFLSRTPTAGAPSWASLEEALATWWRPWNAARRIAAAAAMKTE